MSRAVPFPSCRGIHHITPSHAIAIAFSPSLLLTRCVALAFTDIVAGPLTSGCPASGRFNHRKYKQLLILLCSHWSDCWRHCRGRRCGVAFLCQAEQSTYLTPA